MSAQTYLAMLDAIQTHIADDVDADTYSPHWLLIAGLADIHDEPIDEVMRVYRSLKTPAYVVTGLLDLAIEATTP